MEAKGGGELHYFRALEGGVFFDTSLENPAAFEDGNQARRVLSALRELRRQAGKGPASPFYAVLLMDGDEIGKHMSEVGKQPAITEALASFTKEVPSIVYAHDGFLIYAGGDDVLALLPIDTALNCACTLHNAFAMSFDQATEKCRTAKFTATLSGAIEFAHMNMPLTRILQDSQDLLKEVAKKGRGRDAIACRVWKPGHKAAEWAMPWAKAVDADGKVVIQAMAKDFAQQEQSTPFSSRFFYRIRERLELLQADGAEPNVLTVDQAVWLMAAEYLGSGVNEGRTGKARITLAQAQETVARLLNQCRRWRRSAATDGSYRCEAENRWKADGALLVRFLAQKGMDR